jgi:hypothetical protein
LSIDRPEVIAEGSLVTADISCEAPWDIDDDASDDSGSAIAEIIPLVEFGSGDVVWTLSVATILIGLAWLGGIIGSRKTVSSSKSSMTKSEKPAEKRAISDRETDDISLDDLDDLDDLLDEISELDVTEETIEIVVEEPVVSKSTTNDASASGKLGAMRREIATDDNVGDVGDVEEKDLHSRMDRFFSER